MRKPCIFDIECGTNFFICCCKVIGKSNIKIEISERKFELSEMYNFFTANKYTFVGYNCGSYDTPIMNMLFKNYANFLKGNYIELTYETHNLSSNIVNGGRANYEYAFLNYFPQIDLMTMMSSKALRVGLKSLQVTMCFRNVKEMIINWSEDLDVEKLDSVISYCFNDIDSTAYLFSLLKSDIKLRMDIQKEYGLRCLSKDPVGVGVSIFTKYICEELGIRNEKELYNYMDNLENIYVKDFILPEIKFKTPQFQNVLKEFNALKLNFKGETTVNEWSVNAICGKLKHVFGIGGLHSVNQPKIYISDHEYFILDLDVIRRRNLVNCWDVLLGRRIISSEALI